MHPRLRRLLSATRGAPTLDEWSAFVDAVSAEFEKAQREQDKLLQSVRTLTSLLHDAHESAAAEAAHEGALQKKAIRRTRRLAKALEQSGVAIFDLTPDLIVRS